MDTNILFDYFWAEFTKNRFPAHRNFPEPQSNALALFSRFKEHDFKLNLSDWSFWELKEIVTSQLFQHKCISLGYHMPQDYHRALSDKVPELEKEELETFYSLVASLKNSLESAEFFPLDYKKIDELVDSGCGFIDSILFLQACKNNCDYFVTRDERFIRKIIPILIKEKIETKPILLKDFFAEIQLGISHGG